MKKIIISVTVIGALLASYSCKDTTGEQKVLTKEVVFKKEGALTIKKATNDSLVAQIDIEFADSEYQTQTGLMYRKSMQNDRGMLFLFEKEEPRSFYMKNTEFGLDIIYIDSKRKIVSIQKNAKPLNKTSLPSEGVCQYVLEINAGLSDSWGIEKGDKVSWTKD